MSKQKSGKNPSRSKEATKTNPATTREKLKMALEVLVALSTIITLPVVCLTLREMQIQRDKAYEPAIVFERQELEFLWDGSSESPYINVLNVGVGLARNIVISVDLKTALLSWIDKINKSSEVQYSLKEDPSQEERLLLYRNDQDAPLPFRADFSWEQSYLLPNAEQKETLDLPHGVAVLLAEYAKLGGDYIGAYELAIPLSVSYDDIQGKSFDKVINIYIKTTGVDQSVEPAVTTFLLQTELFFDEGIRFIRGPE